MQITEIRVHRINIPLTTGFRWASGLYLGGTKALVEVQTDEGLVEIRSTMLSQVRPFSTHNL